MNQWVHIDADLLLFTFLPPLIFGEAMSLNWYHVQGGFLQSVILAGPGVLIGAALMGLVAKFLLPYNWNWSLAMVFGSILSATDPVAVVALLKRVGASPKLTILIVGESLLNDGSAMVLFTVFYNTLNGTEYTAGGIIQFMFAAAIGSVLLGIGFGLVTVRWLRSANRPLKEIDVLIQIAITLCCAYLCFFTAQYVLEISGVLACCGAGAMLAWMAPPIILNHESMHNVWGMIEWCLNTLIFLLAGLIIGHRVLGKVHAVDWLYMFMLYIVLLAIRAVTVTILYPFISTIGHRCTKTEAVFMSWAGLRGALGMALSLLVKNNCPDHLQDETSRLFFYVGGIASLTLVINAPTSKSLLYKLGLLGADTAEKMLVTDQIKKKLRRKMDKVITQMAKEFAFTEDDLEEVRMSCTLLNDMNMDALYRDTERMSTLLADATSASNFTGYNQAGPAVAHKRRGSSSYILQQQEALKHGGSSNTLHGGEAAHSNSAKKEDEDEVEIDNNLDDEDDEITDKNKIKNVTATPVENVPSKSGSFTVQYYAAGTKNSFSAAPEERHNVGGAKRGVSTGFTRGMSSSFSGRPRGMSESQHKHESLRIAHMSRLLSVNTRGTNPVIIHELLEYVRAIFLEIVRVKYWHFIEVGKLPRLSHSAQFLLYSVEVGLDEVKHMSGARDWVCLEDELRRDPYNIRILHFFDEYFPSALCGSMPSKMLSRIEARREKRAVYMLSSFIEAHEHAQTKIHSFLGLEDEELEPQTPEEMQVISESKSAVSIIILVTFCLICPKFIHSQVEKARRMLLAMNPETVSAIRSKQAARLVLAKEAEIVKNMVHEGLLTPQHAEEFLEEISKDTERIEKERNRMYK